MKFITSTIPAVLLLFSCGQMYEIEEDTSYRASENLKVKYETYKRFIRAHQDAAGFIDTKYCDATLCSGLVGISGAEVNLTAALDPDIAGRWYRRPVSYKECWANGGSRSTISKDMLLGVMYWVVNQPVSTDYVDILEDIWEYGESRSWVMGEGRWEGVDTIMNPLWISTLAQAIYKLGGKDHNVWRSVSPHFGEAVDYPAHLQVLMLLLRRDLGIVDAEAGRIFRDHAKRQPRNALFQYAAGCPQKAEELLLNPVWWPDHRLPTASDRKASWLFQRDWGPQWEPVDSTEEHHGGDFLFLANLLIKLNK